MRYTWDGNLFSSSRQVRAVMVDSKPSNNPWFDRNHEMFTGRSKDSTTAANTVGAPQESPNTDKADRKMPLKWEDDVDSEHEEAAKAARAQGRGGANSGRGRGGSGRARGGGGLSG